MTYIQTLLGVNSDTAQLVIAGVVVVGYLVFKRIKAARKTSRRSKRNRR